MTTASLAAANRANFEPEVGCGNRRRALRLNQQVMQQSRSSWPVKTALHLSEITGYSTRACEAWLAGKAVLPADALAELLRSENGREFLAAVMAESTPRWWLRLKAWLSAVDLAVEQAKHRRKLRKLLDDASPAPTPAMLLQDEDFYSGQPAPARALAPKKRNGR